MDPSKSEGGWIGIDLGTTNCTVAVWDTNQSSPKVLRLKQLAKPAGSGKDGKIMPSVVLFYEQPDEDDDSPDGDDNIRSERFSTLAGNQALQFTNETDYANRATVTSFKRVVGMTWRQAEELQVSDPDFWNSLPFQAVIVRDRHSHDEQYQKDSVNGKTLDVLGGTNRDVSAAVTTEQEGVAIRINPLPYNPLANGIHPKQQTKTPERLISPLQVTTTLLQSIREAADKYLAKNKKIGLPSIPASTSNGNAIRNCIIGVPAHYSHNQRSAIQSAAEKAGFTGHVGVMTESTAAAMAYGLFVSPNVKCEDKDKRILVFDMGGGTTDVTVAVMNGDSPHVNDGSSEDGVKFYVAATAGDRCLGGDNVDELLARYLWEKMSVASIVTSDTAKWLASEQQDFLRKCRVAKEQLCGNDKEDTAGVNETHFTFDGTHIDITRQEFDTAIRPLIDRAENVVDEALNQMNSTDYSAPIHEVVLVGGSSHIPSVRDMLRRKFPPPMPPDLCTSISAETAVAQGLAIQSALVSGVVPLWELRNALMLDALPHSIGVWVDPSIPNDRKGSPYEKGDIIHADNRCNYVEILQKDGPLPAKGSATFTLAQIDQRGVTVVAAERIGEDTFQCMGAFTFLLHRLDANLTSNSGSTRQIEVGMVLESDGRFIVSVFDDSDPEHRQKKRRFLKQKGFDVEDEEYVGNEVRSSGTEASLMILCAIVFALYVATRIAFSDLELGTESETTDEL